MEHHDDVSRGSRALFASLAVILLARTALAADPVPEREKAERLIRAAEKSLGSVSVSEGHVLEAVAAGEPAGPASEPIRAELLNWLCSDPAGTERLPPQGVVLKKVRIAGDLDLRYAKLLVPLTFHDCELDDVDVSHATMMALTIAGGSAGSFEAEELRVERDLSLKSGFECPGRICLASAWIEGHLDLAGASLTKSDGDALIADVCRINGDGGLGSGLKTAQRISFTGARIAGNVDLSGAQLHAADVALHFPGARIGGDCVLRGAAVDGGIVCHGTHVSGDLDADGSRLCKAEGTALRGYALSVDGDLRFVGASLAGDVLLEAAEIGRDLNFADARFDQVSRPVEVNLQGMKVARRFRWTEIEYAPDHPVQLDLRFATVGVLFDDQASWPQPGRLRLHGFDYAEIHDDAPFDSTSRIEWLRRQHTDRFRTQPYEQLAENFRKGGQAAAAREVLIAKEGDRAARSKTLSAGDWIWYRVFGPMIGYGYAPGLAFGWMIGVVLLGAAFFQTGYWLGWMSPTKVVEFISSDDAAEPHISPDYPKFNAIVYSLDVFTPLTYLHQASYWVPNPQRGPALQLGAWKCSAGDLLRSYLWLHVVAGWTLTSLLIAGLSGLMQH